MDAVSPQSIAQCEQLIRPHIRRTPVVEVDGREFGLPANSLTLKLELLQHSGSFKARGAFANLLTRAVPEAGVVAASGGNHGAAVAYAAMTLGKPAKIFVPSVSSSAKVERIREYGADLVIEGDRYADALAASDIWAQRTGAMLVPAFDQNETIMGQGTLGLELDRQAPDIDTVLVSVGGGGLVVRRPRQGPWCRTICIAHAEQGLGGRASGRCGGRRTGCGFAGAAARRRMCLSDRPEIRAANRARFRRGDCQRAGDAVARLAHRGRAGRGRRVLGVIVRSLCARARRARRRHHQRRQYRRSEF